MIKKNSAGGEDAIGLPVVDRCPVREQLGNTVRATRIKRSVLILRNGLDLAEHLRRGSLIEADLPIHDSDRLQKIKRPHGRDFRRSYRLVKRESHEALGGEIVNFVWL